VIRSSCCIWVGRKMTCVERGRVAARFAFNGCTKVLKQIIRSRMTATHVVRVRKGLHVRVNVILGAKPQTIVFQNAKSADNSIIQFSHHASNVSQTAVLLLLIQSFFLARSFLLDTLINSLLSSARLRITFALLRARSSRLERQALVHPK
jgi:hypothetical protein